PLNVIQTPVPTILYGPGTGVTVGRPVNIFQIALPFNGGPISLRLNSAVTVPDGGTASVGGVSSLSEGPNEFGPPLLSNTPYLGRLFRNVGYGREVSNFRVLVGVRIISMAEEEQRFLEQGGVR